MAPASSRGRGDHAVKGRPEYIIAPTGKKVPNINDYSPWLMNRNDASQIALQCIGESALCSQSAWRPGIRLYEGF